MQQYGKYYNGRPVLYLTDTKNNNYVLVPNGWYCGLYYKGDVIDAFYNTSIEDYINEHNLTITK